VVAAKILGAAPDFPSNKILPKPQPASLSAIASDELANNAIAKSFFIMFSFCVG
jgi:hypothetical protein